MKRINAARLGAVTLDTKLITPSRVITRIREEHVKTLILRAVIVGVCVASAVRTTDAQSASPIGKGSWIASGSAGISHDGGDQQSTTNVFLSPSGLYFVRARWAVGGSFEAGYTSISSASTRTLGLGPEVRYFAADLTDRTLPFLRVAVRPAWTRFKQDGQPYAASLRELQWEGGAGLTQLLVAHVGLTAELYYTKIHAHADDGGIVALDHDLTNDSYGLRLGITAFVF